MFAIFLVNDCGPLNHPDNGQVDASSGTTFGSTATYTCDTGYTLSGSQSRTCGADGMWTSTQTYCEGNHIFPVPRKSLTYNFAVVDCGLLADPENGQVDISNGTVFQSTATYTCSVVTSSSSRTCGADGLWSLTEPTCTYQTECKLYL